MWDINTIKAKLYKTVWETSYFFSFHWDTVREGVSWQISPESIWSVQDLTLQTCAVKDPASSQAGGRGYPSQGLFSNPHTPHRRARTHAHTPALISTNCCWTLISLACQVFHTLQKLILTSPIYTVDALKSCFYLWALAMKWWFTKLFYSYKLGGWGFVLFQDRPLKKRNFNFLSIWHNATYFEEKKDCNNTI